MKVWLIACALLCTRASLPLCDTSDCFEVSAALDAEVPTFAGLDAAIAATASLPSATLRLLPSSTAFHIATPATIAGQLAIQGSAQVIEFSKSVEVRGALRISNVAIHTDANARGFSVFFLANGVVHVSDSTVSAIRTTFISGTGTVELEDSTMTHNFAPIVSIGSGKVTVLIERTVLLYHTGEFFQVLPIVGTAENVTITLNNCRFANCTGSGALIDYSVPYFAGSITVSNSQFEGNQIWLMFFDIGAIHLSIAGCSFLSNKKASIFLYAKRSLVTISDSKWQGNSQLLFDIRQLSGDLIATNITVVKQITGGVFYIRNTLTPAECRATLQNSLMLDFGIFDSVTTAGVVYAFGCTVLVSQVTIYDVAILAPGGRGIEGLLAVMVGYLDVKELYVWYSGTSGYGLGVGAGVLRVSDSLLDSLVAGRNINLGITSGTLVVSNVTFTEPLKLKSTYTLGIDVPLYFGALGSYVEIRNLQVIPGYEVYLHDNVLSAQYSTVNISGVLVRDLYIDNVALFQMVDGSVSNVTIKNCTFGYSVFSVSSVDRIEMSGIVVTDVANIRLNRGIFAPTVHMNIDCSDFTFRNVSTRSIVASRAGQVRMKRVTIENSRFDYLIYYQVNTDILLQGFNVKGTTGGLAIALCCSIQVLDSTFFGLSGNAYIIWGESVNFTLERVAMNDFSSPLSLSRFSASSQLLISQSAFSNYRSLADEAFVVDSGGVTVVDSHFDTFNVALFQVVGCPVTIRSSQFREIKNNVLSEKSNAAYGGVLGCTDCPSVTVESSSFLNVSAIRGGAVAVHGSTSRYNWVRISDCEFVMCSATAGGAVYLFNSTFLIKSSRFISNSATSTGGAVDTFTDFDTQTVIRNCSFFRNSAKEGGGVKWWKAEVTLSNITFQDNSAVYGPNVASFGVRLVGSLPFVTDAAASGYPLQLIFELQDHYGQRVATANTQESQLVSNAQVNYRGNQAALISRGVFNYSELTIYAQPNSRQTIAGQMHSVEDGIAHTLDGSIDITFRDCVSGEVRKADRCEYCFAGNVSFDPSDSECSYCPKKAFCPGGNALILDAHYWRSSNSTSTLHRCPLIEACLGGQDSKCAEGYTGQMCNECSSDFTRIRAIECEKCPNPILLWFKISFIVFPVAGLCTAVMTASDVQFFILKQAINHAQLLYTLSYFRISLPAVIKYWLHSLSYISSLYITELPISCLSTYSAEYIRAVIGSGVTPAFCLLLLPLYRRKWKSWVIQCTSALLFIPMISLYTQMPLLACQTVESEVEWLFLDMSQQCWEGTHLLFIKALVVPSVVVNVLLPIVLVCVVSIRAPKQFDELFPIWRSGLKWRCWELFIHCMKGFLISLVTVATVTGQLSQLTYGILVLIIASVMAVVLNSHAYTHWKLFFLMEHSLVIVAVSMGLCAYFIYHSPNEGVTDWLVTGVFVALNAGYFAVCVKLWVFPPDLTIEKETVIRCEMVPPNSLVNSLSDLRHQS